MKPTPDWMCSSNSIYFKDSKSLVGGLDNFVHARDTRLSRHRTRFKFIQLENHFSVFKYMNKAKNNTGMNNVYLYIYLNYSSNFVSSNILPYLFQKNY